MLGNGNGNNNNKDDARSGVGVGVGVGVMLPPVVPVAARNGRLVLLASPSVAFWRRVRHYGSLALLGGYLALCVASPFVALL